MSSKTIYTCDWCGKEIKRSDYYYPPFGLSKEAGVITININNVENMEDNDINGIYHFHATPVGCEQSKNKIRCYENFCKLIKNSIKGE